LTLDGHRYEAFITSGGMGTLVKDFEDLAEDGRVRNINYKSLREVGHYSAMTFLIDGVARDRKALFEIMTKNIPYVRENDYVVIYVSVSGTFKGRVEQRHFYKRFDGKAIQRTTAGGLLAVLELHKNGDLKRKSGILNHAWIDFDKLMYTASWHLLTSLEFMEEML
jgi:saccharopine dehydrogenase-like NADP-dependent oxidoreductase